MKSFIRVVEVWVPAGGRGHLELADGLYGECQAFAESSRDLRFAIGDGLPGRAWAGAEPVILHHIDDPYFRRPQEARAAGISGGFAFPVFAGDYLMAVLVFLFSAGEAGRAGAVEVWASDPLGQLALKDGYYGSMDDFAWTSKRIRFQRDRGLPGRAWTRRFPVLMGNLGDSETFLRAHDAKRAGLTTGLALPCFCPQEKDLVVTLLSGLEHPIARRFEIWIPNRERTALVFHDGCALDGPLPKSAHRRRACPRGEGVLGRAWAAGVPMVVDHASVVRQPIPAGGAPDEEPPEAVLAVPMLDDGALSAVAAFYL